jgi:Transposase DDE domain
MILYENAKTTRQEDHPMWQQEFTWFFALFHHEFRQGHRIAFEVLMALAFAHFFGFYNPKQLADFLDIPHQKLYAQLKDCSLYYIKEILVRFMVKQAVEHLKPALSKSAATQSRSGMTLSIDNSVIDRLGKLLRCTWSWYSGRHHDVVRGQDLLGIVLTIHHIALPLHLLFCPKQGRYNTNKADLLIFMLSRLKAEFAREGVDLTKISLTMDSWFVSQPLRTRLHRLGFTKIIIAGKSNYTFTIDSKKQKASQWKKDLVLHDPQWGIDVPSCRVRGHSPTFGSIILFFFQKSTTRSFYLMNFSQVSMRGAEIWHIWKQHHLIECFWKILKSIFHIRSMQLQGNGLYTALLIKVLAYLLAIRLKAHWPFSQWTITQIMRHLSRNHGLRDLMMTHFHVAFPIT